MESARKFVSSLLLSLLIVLCPTAAVYAFQSNSSSYGVDETFFGNGGELNACSTTYCSKQTAGDTAVGNSKSTNFQTQAGNLTTDRTPYIEMIVNATSVDIGTLTTTTTATATATFSVKTYLAGGYIVVNSSPGPKNGSYTMQGLTTATPSAIGNEQFGINLVANTCPASAPSSGPGSCTGTLGANLTQAPGSTFSFGTVSPSYATANNYKYVNGDTIAYSNSSSGETDYTISYIFNVSNVTPGGTYVLQHNLVATSTY